MISDQDVLKIARLANLEIRDDEMPKLVSDLGSILDFVQTLDEVAVEGVEPLSHVHGATNVFRPDQVEPSLERSSALKNANSPSDVYFQVPLVIDSGEGSES